MHKVVYFNPILSQAPKQYLEMCICVCVCMCICVFAIKYHYILFFYYSSIQDSLNCYDANHDF